MYDYGNNLEMKKYIDIDDGLNRIRGNKKLYLKMLKMILINEEFDKIKEYVKAADYDGAEKSAHSIKGMAGNLSLPRLFEQSVELMRQFKTDAPDLNAAEEFNDIWTITKSYIEQVIGEWETQI